MVPQCFVDGDVTYWNAEDDDPVGCDVDAVVVYHPEIARRAFERECDWLEDRADAFAEALMEAASRRGGRFGIVDATSARQAEAAVENRFGESFLETFVNDTRMVALERIGSVFARARAIGAATTPSAAMMAVDVCPAKSFRTMKALEGYLHDSRANWKPAVRLTISVSFDGPFDAVEDAAAMLRSTLSSCGPVTEWRQRIRPCRQETEKVVRLRVVTG